MTNLHICGVDRLSATIARTNPDLVISITDPSTDSIYRAQQQMRDYDGPVISLDFHDIEVLSNHNRAFSMQMGHLLVGDIDEYFPNQDGTIVIHCTMGVSRSTAVAILALSHIYARTQTPSDDLAKAIVDQVYDAAPNANPNMRVVEIADHVVDGYEGACVFAVHDRRNASMARQINPSASRTPAKKKLKKKAFRA